MIPPNSRLLRGAFLGNAAFSGRGVWTVTLVAVNFAAWGLLQAASGRASARPRVKIYP